MKPVTRVTAEFRKRFESEPAICSYAPGRVEILGNHTDYNEGFVLSCAIDLGMAFAVGPSDQPGRSRLIAADLDQSVEFRTSAPAPADRNRWANYPKGVLYYLLSLAASPRDFVAVFGGNIPPGAGLSSSAALEVSSGLCLTQWLGRELPPMELAKICQRAEFEFAGVKCGLLDQITSLFGREGHLVHTDFRTLDVQHISIPAAACFLLCNTGVRHRLVESEYNERRAACGEAAIRLADYLGRPVSALRDVSMAELRSSETYLDPRIFRRALHVIGENERVVRGLGDLAAGDLDSFGRQMSASHESSRDHFENSCAELDEAVQIVRLLKGTYGARLSGGGFGGSVVALVHAEKAESLMEAWRSACSDRWRRKVDIRRIWPSRGARRVSL